MDIRRKITNVSLAHYKLVTLVMVLFTLGLGLFIPRMLVDTDPENMLSKTEPVRVFHDVTKRDFMLYDVVVLGIVNDKDPNGVFNVSSLNKIHALTEHIKTWRSQKDPNEGVVEVDIMAPSLMDHISQGGAGEVRFEWLMPRPPQSEAEARAIRDKAMSNPLLHGTMVSENGRALCIYIPLTSKHVSHELYQDLSRYTAQVAGDETFHITGLPVAEDTFGHEMFIQMGISAPLAMLVIFLLMFLFFRKLVLVISPMIVALVSVISTMGLLIAFGYPVHIMSSMIPIFLMPISVVDSVHILSKFFDLYTREKGRQETTLEVMSDLFIPMLYTSLTSAAGFASLALTPIPPVQVFGIFVAIGIMIAWVCTVTFVPASIMMLRERSLENFGAAAVPEQKQTGMSRLLDWAGGLTYTWARPILALMVILVGVAVYGITRIQINDNPTKWFSTSHPIRRADIELNKHFGGTYMAFLVLADPADPALDNEYIDALRRRLLDRARELQGDDAHIARVVKDMDARVVDSGSRDMTKTAFLDNLIQLTSGKEADANEAEADIWYELTDFLESQKQDLAIFKYPEVLRYVARLQDFLGPRGRGYAGKSNSVADIVKKVHQELLDGQSLNYRIPDSSDAVAQCLLQFESSHTPDDLWHFVTKDYQKANVWLQLRSGDNQDMEEVVRAVERFFTQNKPPVPLTYHWAGLTYINTVWQEKMVFGMLQALLGSFIIVFIMMAVLFRSVLWGLMCMIPLSITIVVIYGIIGLTGRDYDMPVAVLSALTLGMAVDFAIHFLERARIRYRQTGSWTRSVPLMFGDPARAITRNVLVIAIGFLPLLAAPLVPYQTVGVFLCAIMALSGVVTLLVLPALLTVIQRRAFKPARTPQSAGCNCVFCLIISVAWVVLVTMTLHQYWHLGWTRLAWIGVITVPLLLVICGVLSRRQACKIVEEQKAG